MPWKEPCAMKERTKFVREKEPGEVPITILSCKYGSSRTVGYKWLEWYELLVVDGLQDRSRTARHHCHAVPWEREEAIVAPRRRHRYWEPQRRQWLKAGPTYSSEVILE